MEDVSHHALLELILILFLKHVDNVPPHVQLAAHSNIVLLAQIIWLLQSVDNAYHVSTHVLVVQLIYQFVMLAWADILYQAEIVSEIAQAELDLWMEFVAALLDYLWMVLVLHHALLDTLNLAQVVKDANPHVLNAQVQPVSVLIV